jgi:hypothetical protein
MFGGQAGDRSECFALAQYWTWRSLLLLLLLLLLMVVVVVVVMIIVIMMHHITQPRFRSAKLSFMSHARCSMSREAGVTELRRMISRAFIHNPFSFALTRPVHGHLDFSRHRAFYFSLRHYHCHAYPSIHARASAIRPLFPPSPLQFHPSRISSPPATADFVQSSRRVPQQLRLGTN